MSKEVLKEKNFSFFTLPTRNGRESNSSSQSQIRTAVTVTMSRQWRDFVVGDRDWVWLSGEAAVHDRRTKRLRCAVAGRVVNGGSRSSEVELHHVPRTWTTSGPS